MNIKSFSLTNSFGHIVSVECDITSGIPSLNIIGLPRGAVKEADSRVRSGLINSGFSLPGRRVVINLYPADIVKDESLFDLAIAVKILDQTSQIDYDSAQRCEFFQQLSGIMFLGEFHLDGQIGGVNGVLAAVIEGVKQGITYFVVPSQNCSEASAVDGAIIYGVESLNDLKAFFLGVSKPYFRKANHHVEYQGADFSDCYINDRSSFAMAVLAAGRHNGLFFGPPGTGKSMLARRIPSLMQLLDSEAALETSKLYSAAGLLRHHDGLIRIPPFREPHHSSSIESLVGGGSLASPGDISLAHNGILFLDELPEFKPSVIQSLREPIESKKVVISRVAYKLELPADFMLIATMNLCPCGNYGKAGANCICSYYQKRSYINRVGGAILDRFDLGLCLADEEFDLEFDPSKNHNTMRDLAQLGISIQQTRFKDSKIKYNSQLDFNLVKKHSMISSDNERFLKNETKKNSFSLRNLLSIIKIARTIEDLQENNTQISRESLELAVDFKKALLDPLNYYNLLK
ncbi:MAG: YifB family Mg chelatase-like AAA ATPase [Spirochaetales bacterium]|nr:YifB family Mg chelatase-like AAA ATPase [Spirochaetales bacterium]